MTHESEGGAAGGITRGHRGGGGEFIDQVPHFRRVFAKQYPHPGRVARAAEELRRDLGRCCRRPGGNARCRRHIGLQA